MLVPIFIQKEHTASAGSTVKNYSKHRQTPTSEDLTLLLSGK